ncbi:MAG TPA: CsgG/HfaB family protein [Vicinamibacterales bacterium]|nr:CsgG/HfaB family protein [Vicinamibacterales bacterium]
MTRRKLLGLILVGLVRVTVATGAMAQDASARPAIAIADVTVSPGGWTLPPPRLSSAIIELMMGELVSSQRFRVYDGQWLVPEAEIGRANLERLRAAAADRHVDYVVVGSLTSFSNENRKRRFGGILPKPIMLGGFSREQAQLRVSMTFRIVDVHTGEIVVTATGDGLGMRRATSVGAGGVIHGLPLGALAGAARLPAARDAMLDEAVKKAVHTAALALAQATLPVREHQ